MKRTLVVLAAIALLVGNVACSRQAVAAQPPPAAQSPGMGGMMKMHEQMMTEMRKGDARLQTLVEQMNAANGTAKVTAMAAVVSELVAQQKMLHEQMGSMHREMMRGGMMMNR